MTEREYKDKIKRILNESTLGEELIELHNNSVDGEGYIYSMEDFDELLDGTKPMDLANKIYYGSFMPNQDYFRFNAYENLESSDTCYDWFDFDAIADYIFDHKDTETFTDEIEEVTAQYNEEEAAEEEEE